MKIRFKIQTYQTGAVKAVTDCFTGQPNFSGALMQFAQTGLPTQPFLSHASDEISDSGVFGNAALLLSHEQILANIQKVQHRHNLPISAQLLSDAVCDIALDIEMETGTGKTYCYIKTIFELNKQYGWTKFIIVVPSVAIREGALRSLEITADHFSESYGKRARFFSYNSKELHPLESFSSDADITIMVINTQAFNATSKDNRRIYEELEDFQSRRPIDIISMSRPVLILDEPQKMEGGRTLEGLSRFKPLFALRYSATHRTTRNKVYRLDALDAYNRKLVKKIAVRGISVQNVSGTKPYLYLESIEVSTQSPVACIEMEVRRKNTIKRMIRRLGSGADLFRGSNGLEQYKGFVITQIDAGNGFIEFRNGETLHTGDVIGDVTEETFRRIQIRETIRAHLTRERVLFGLGIKTLSLFFIDEVVKYRDYTRPDEQGYYARIFEEEYNLLKTATLALLQTDPSPCDREYERYLAGIDVRSTHSGYFSIDRKTNRLTDPGVAGRGKNAGFSDDADAYDLILRDKERLLSFDEPVRFIFSHSALREGWDNPNIFVMCMLKRSDNTISRRQEVGRGLRICVNQFGERMDNPLTVHDVNVLTVVAGESYRDFVSNLQKEIYDALSSRPHKADIAYFTSKKIRAGESELVLTPDMAKTICRYLAENAYIDEKKQISTRYYESKAKGLLVPLPSRFIPFQTGLFSLFEGVLSRSSLPGASDDRKAGNKNETTTNNEESVSLDASSTPVRIAFDSSELIHRSVQALNSRLRVPRPSFALQSGEQRGEVGYSALRKGDAFGQENTVVESAHCPAHIAVRYDLLGEVSSRTSLTRKTVAEILSGIDESVFALYKENPEQFIAEASRLINGKKKWLIDQGV